MSFFRSPNRRSAVDQRVNSNGTEPARSIRAFLDCLGYADWYRAASVHCYGTDPWQAFTCAQRSASQAAGKLTSIIDLFVSNGAVSESTLRASIEDDIVDWLFSHGVLRRVREHAVRSNYCLLSCFGDYIFLDWPVATPTRRLVALDTYLSGSSFDCANAVQGRETLGRCLELGSGSGLVASLMAARSPFTVAVDIDPTAVKLTRLNLSLNERRASIIHGDLTGFLSANSRFDFVVVNPPWRIVPPGIAYPNPVARVGRGFDGLDSVRHVLRVLPACLSARGEAFIRFDIPLNASGRADFFKSTESLQRRGLVLDSETINVVTVHEQAAISADTCSHLNQDVADLESRFRDHYTSLGISALQQVQCTVRKDVTLSSNDRESALEAISSPATSASW